MEKDFFAELIDWIVENKPNKQKLANTKLKLCKKYNMRRIPTDIEVYLQASPENTPKVRKYLQTKPTRTGSGVAVVATMTAPFPCPHGSCTYCPGGPNSAFGDTPKSYTGKEPSTMRGIRNNYDPYRIIFNRLEQYIVLGQNPDKVDQIIMGGTFPALPKEYQEEFVYYSFKAYNDFSEQFYKDNKLDINRFKEFFELPGSVNDEERIRNIKKKVLELKNRNNDTTLLEEQKRNETATIRCIGLTIETKPDWGRLEHGLEMLRFGTTRIELGVQTVYDECLEATHRGHDLNDTKNSIAELRNLGFKLNFHMMPGLPGKDKKRISREKDISALNTLFSDDNYKPDMLKIYPCMVMPGTALEVDFKKGLYTPLTTEEAADIIVEMKRNVPRYCRIMRVQRDIPTFQTVAGVNKTNLRQYVDKLAKERDVHCQCIRCREVKNQKVSSEPEIVVEEYDANDGREFFISVEANNVLFGFVRMRFPNKLLHPVITKDSALIRELHVYGSAVKIGNEDSDKSQHRGFGKMLMKKVESIAKKAGKNKMIVISGVGVREYYKKIGYSFEDPYMVKSI